MTWRSWSSGVISQAAIRREGGEQRRRHPWLFTFSALALATLALLVIVLVWSSGRALSQQEQTQWWRTHTLKVLIDAERLDTALNEALRGERGYVLTGDPRSLAAFRRGLGDYRSIVTELRALTRDNAAQQRRVNDLDRRVRAFGHASRHIVNLVTQGKQAAALAAVRAGREHAAIDDFSSTLDEVKAEEHRLLTVREQRDDESAARTGRYTHIFLGTAVLLLALLTAAVAAMLRSRELALRAAVKIRRSEYLYRLLADHSNDMIVRIGLDGIRRYVSPACHPLLGYYPEEMVGTASVAAIHVEDRARVVDVCQTLLTGAENPVCSYRQRHRDGHYVWLEASYRLIRSDAGEPLEFVASVRDISTRHAAEREATAAAARLHENNRLFAMAASIAQVGHWHVDLVRGRVIWADEVRRIHGVGDDYVPTLENAIDFYQVEDRERVTTLVRLAAEEGQPFAFTGVMVRGDGSIGNVAVQGQAERAPDGDIIGIFGVIQDISKQVAAEASMRSSERMHRLLAEASSDIIVRFALDGTPLYVSPACYPVLGFAPEEMMIRGAVRDIHPDDREKVLSAWTEVVRGKKAAICLYRQRRRDGQEVWLEAAYHLANAEATGGEPEIVATVRDVTRRRIAELATVEARERAEAAVRSKANFLADMSHEIRTPMNGVVGFTDLLLAGELSPDQRRRAELIADSGRSMVRLLNDILDLSKIEAQRMTIATEPYDLAHALGACAKLVRPAIEQKGIDLLCDFSDALPKAVLGDGLRVRQIVLNLLGNAAKFTDAGSITLRARINRQAGGAVLSISVEDTGIGIAPDRQAAIFEEFVQADHSIAPRFGGTGLGLSISARLASLMGGELRLESEPGRGSCFILILPLTPATMQPVGVAATIEPGTPPSVLTHPAHVLVAEDHDINQCLIADMLDRLGCRHGLAVNGREAVEMVAAAAAAGDPYSIVLMDMQMPEADGLEATRRIRAAGSDAQTLPIVALTANAYAEDVAACLDAGMQAHLGKPVMLADLTATLRRWAGQPAPVVVANRFSPKIHAKYQERKADTLMRLEELVSRGEYGDAAVSDVAELLHKLAGTAAMFGDAALGTAAKQLEDGLLQWPGAERAQRVGAALPALLAVA